MGYKNIHDSQRLLILAWFAVGCLQLNCLHLRCMSLIASENENVCTITRASLKLSPYM